MKKHIFALAFSAAIFTISPLCAMEEPDYPGSGNLRVLHKENLVSIMEHLSLPDAVSFICTSRRMWELDKSPEIWEAFLPISIPRQLNIENQVNIKNKLCDYYVPFMDINKNYYISMAKLQSFRQNPILDSNPTAYNFSIRGVPFCLTYLQANDIGTGTHEVYLNMDFSLCDRDAHVIFSKKPNTVCFQAQFTLLNSGDVVGVVDEYGIRPFSPEFDKRVEECTTKFPGIVGGDIMGCSFTVEKK